MPQVRHTENFLARMQFYLCLLSLMPSLTLRAAMPSSAFPLPSPSFIPILAARSSSSWEENHKKDESECLRFTWQSFLHGHVPGGHGDHGGAPCPCSGLASRQPRRLAGKLCLCQRAESYFAVRESCTLTYPAITWRQQHTEAVPCLQGLQHFICGAHRSQIVPFVIVWGALKITGYCRALPYGRERREGLYPRHAIAAYS